MTTLEQTSVQQLHESVMSGQVSVRDVTEHALRRILAGDSTLHSFLTVAEKQALQAADDLDSRTSAGEQPGPLWGIPFSVKDIYDTRGVRTTYGSLVFRDHVPDRDAEVVARIRQAGGVLVGKTNTPEFAIYIRTLNDLQDETVNPWDPRRTSGGSSGGAAASVAAGFTPLAIASDGGGSTRIPAALCGLVGLMPSRGAVPRTGGFIGTRRFSAAGPVAVEAEDALALWRVICGPSCDDPLSRSLSPTGVKGEPFSALRPRLRWIGDSGAQAAEHDVVTAVRAAAERLAEVLGVGLDSPGRSLDSVRFQDPFYDVMQADRLSTGGRALLQNPDTRSQLTAYARHHLERAATVDGAAYSWAMEMQLQATEHVLGLLDAVDVLITPTVGFVAPEIPTGSTALPEEARRAFVAYTFLANYTGFPAVTVPCGLVRGMPVGLQLVSRPGTDAVLLELCVRFQRDVYRLPEPPQLLTDQHPRSAHA